MSQQKRCSNMQYIAKAFHFTKQDLLLNRQGKLSEAQRKRLWRRYWMGLTLMIILFLLGGGILGVFLWGTAPDGTFTFLPSNTVFGDDTSDPQLFFFGQVCGGLFMVVMIIAAISMSFIPARIRRGEVHIYRGVIRISKGYDDNRLKLIDEGRSFEIDDEQYDVLKPFVDQRSFAVYYLITRDGIVSIEPI